MSRHGIHHQPTGWIPVAAGIGAVVLLSLGLAAVGLLLAGIADLVFD